MLVLLRAAATPAIQRAALISLYRYLLLLPRYFRRFEARTVLSARVIIATLHGSAMRDEVMLGDYKPVSRFLKEEE